MLIDNFEWHIINYVLKAFYIKIQHSMLYWSNDNKQTKTIWKFYDSRKQVARFSVPFRDYTFVHLWRPCESGWGILKFVKSLWILYIYCSFLWIEGLRARRGEMDGGFVKLIIFYEHHKCMTPNEISSNKSVL